MVSLEDVQSSNARAATALQPGVVAVFAGATAGIGETSLREFARVAPQPHIYFIGRSQEAGDRLTAELKTLNPAGEYVFVRCDASLLRNVDDICRDIEAREQAINVLFISQGTLRYGVDTSEGLPYMMALTYYSRMRLLTNLLPLLRAAPGLRRVVTVFAAGYEGAVQADDVAGRGVSLGAARGHAASVLTLALERAARGAPDVSFVHDHPGSVDTGLVRADDGAVLQVVKWVFKAALLFVAMPLRECGERHAFLCSSARFPPGDGAARTEADGVPLGPGVEVATGSDGTVGSGVYSVSSLGESSGPEVLAVLAKMRAEGVVERLWEHTMGEFRRITGCEAI